MAQSDGVYRLFGNFWLPAPEEHLHDYALQQLRQLEPHLRELEARPITESLEQDKKELNLLEEFHRFQELESSSWTYPRRKDELVPPSGELSSPIAHHLHNPSFQTLAPHAGQTADATSSCVWIVMAKNFVPGKTLIFDHLARRESVDGFTMYPQNVLQRHENWLAMIRAYMEAKIEVLYGKLVCERMQQICDLEPLKLWGRHDDCVVFLEWAPKTANIGRKLLRILVPALHPQVFLSPGGSRYGPKQDKLLQMAHELAGLVYAEGFYTNFNTSMVNQSGIRPHHYARSKELATIAQMELEKNLAAVVKRRKLRAMSKLHQIPTQQEIDQFERTKLAQKFRIDLTKPAVINVQCKVCKLPDKDYKPIWCKKTGKYVARKKRCRDPQCKGRVAIPEDLSIDYVSYWLRPATSTILDSASTAQLLQNSSVAQEKDETTLQESAENTAKPRMRTLQKENKPISYQVSTTTLPQSPTDTKAKRGYSSRETLQIGQDGEKGPHELWHGRLPVITKMGRVRIWVVSDKDNAKMRVNRIDFSAYGIYLLESGKRILDFNARGISLISPEGRDLWHADVNELASRKNGDVLLQLHRQEIEAYRGK